MSGLREAVGDLLAEIPSDAASRPEVHDFIEALVADLAVADRIPDSGTMRPADDGRPLIIDGKGAFSAADLHREARSLAAFLARRGLHRGDVVSMMLPNWHEACVVSLAANLGGFILNPLLPAFRERELSYVLSDAGSRALIAPAEFRRYDYRPLLDRVRTRQPGIEVTLAVRGDPDAAHAWQGALGGDTDWRSAEPYDPRAPKWLLYTSGTTGRPKGVLHNHATLALEVLALSRFWSVGASDRFLVPSPVSHIGGALYAFEFPWLVGTSAVLMDVWDPETAFDLMEQHRCTKCAGATPFLSQIVDVSRKRGHGLPSLDLFVCGGAAVSRGLIEAAAARLGCHVTRVYGSTEVPTVTIGTPRGRGLDRCAETDGLIGLADVEVRSVTSGAVLGPGQEGEIVVRAPQMFDGYLHPDDTRQVVDDRGYFRTGDLGVRDADDFLTITGRIKDLIIRSGENISAKEVEDALCEHPAIRDAAVVGIPDPRTGERVCAFVVADTGVDLAEVSEFLSHRGMSRFKFPECIATLAELPRNASGKLRKDLLREDARQRWAGDA